MTWLYAGGMLGAGKSRVATQEMATQEMATQEMATLDVDRRSVGRLKKGEATRDRPTTATVPATGRSPQMALRLGRDHGPKCSYPSGHPGRRGMVPLRPNGAWLWWTYRSTICGWWLEPSV